MLVAKLCGSPFCGDCVDKIKLDPEGHDSKDQPAILCPGCYNIDTVQPFSRFDELDRTCNDLEGKNRLLTAEHDTVKAERDLSRSQVIRWRDLCQEMYNRTDRVEKENALLRQQLGDLEARCDKLTTSLERAHYRIAEHEAEASVRNFEASLWSSAPMELPDANVAVSLSPEWHADTSPSYICDQPHPSEAGLLEFCASPSPHELSVGQWLLES
ncbi:uncharacterized protein SCHCODRAFT_02677152 [Schizophyllum commune H4-8]|nr:uncharacterized protein SCHCODRAFT_02677152 [Schizophyllum commune H4-8]KAI5895565.1 hypothetical protein SCHCODRAFT_02677152 [Schizophyllum commune H4-8]